MKLAAVNPRPEFNFDNFLNKEVTWIDSLHAFHQVPENGHWCAKRRISSVTLIVIYSNMCRLELPSFSHLWPCICGYDADESMSGNMQMMMQTRSPETTLMGPDPLPSSSTYGELQYQRQQMLQQQILPGSCSLDFRTVGTACDAYLRLSSSVQVPASLQVSPEAYSDPLSQVLRFCRT